MPAGLKRYYVKGHLHFITFSCYGRLPLLKTARGIFSCRNQEGCAAGRDFFPSVMW